MSKKVLLISMLIVVLVLLVALCGCQVSERVDMTGKTAVVYVLEGGKYQNCLGKFTHYYDVAENEEILIYDPESLTGGMLERAGYTFDGWYEKKIVKPNEDFCAAVLGELKVQDGEDSEIQFVKAELPFDEEKEYCLQIDQTILGKTLYVTNSTLAVKQNVLLATTEDESSASNVYVENLDNSYLLYFMNGEKKSYISYEIVDEKILNFVLVESDAKDWAFDEEKGCFKTAVEVKLKGKKAYTYYLGTIENNEDARFSENVGFCHNVESVGYQDKWDFTKNRIKDDGVTLYAKWASKVVYRYRVVYVDETTGELKVLGTYDVDEGAKFDDYQKYISKGRKGAWTAIGIKDSEGNPWNDEFRHPGGEESTSVDVYVEFIKGTFALCGTADELLGALSEKKNANIYLTADIDMGGETLNFGDYMGDFRGNGFTVSNFKVGYNATKDGLSSDLILNASIFGNAYKASISDVTFDNVTLEYVSKLSSAQGLLIGVLGSRVENTTISNVKVKNMTIILKVVPSNLTEDDITIVTDKLCAETTDDVVIEGDCSVENVVVKNGDETPDEEETPNGDEVQETPEAPKDEEN